MPAPQEDLARKIAERYDALRAMRSPWESLWSEIAKYVIPRRIPGLNGAVQTSPGTGNDALLFDTTAIRANMTLANGQLAWMSPLEAAWFAFEAKPGQDGDESKRWLSSATKIARDELAISSFYTAVHEFYLDRGAFGTACLYVEPGRRNAINAQIWPVGTFVIDQDENGLVDTVMREFTLTARQAVQKFGEEYVSEKVQKLIADGGAKSHEKLKYLHAIYPREDAERDAGKKDAQNMPIASVYMEAETKHVCHIGGYEEMPVMVSRYLEWGSATGGMYGWSPAFEALPTVRQLNFLQKMMDALAEKMAFPPILAPEELEGEIDGNANGVTYFSRDLAQGGSMPKEWMTQGRYDVGLERIKERQEEVNDSFHVDLFQMFAQIEKQMTAREVSERANEKLIQFSPTFARLTSELFNPLLERVFGILLRGGQLGPLNAIPQGMLQPLGNGTALVPTPNVQYSSRIALALRSLPSIGYQRTLERLQGVIQLSPAVVDVYDFDEAERATAMSDGVPNEFLRPEAEMKKLRTDRAKAQAAQAQQQQAMMAADAASKVGRIPAGSPVGQALQDRLTQQQPGGVQP